MSAYLELPELHEISLAQKRGQNELSHVGATSERRNHLKDLNEFLGRSWETGSYSSNVIRLWGVEPLEPAEVFYYEEPWWRTGRFVGYLRVGDLDVAIVPRVGWKVFLLMLRYAVGLDAVALAEGGGGTRAELPRQILSLLWSLELERATRRHGGLLKGYVRKRDLACESLRGRLEIVQQLRNQLSGRAHKFACTYNDLTYDIFVNRGIVFVSRILRNEGLFPFGMGTHAPLKQFVSGVEQKLIALGTKVPRDFPKESAGWTRATAQFRRVHEIGRLLATFKSGSFGLGHGDAVLLDSAEVYEMFLYRILRDAAKKLSLRVESPRLEGKKDYLFTLDSPKPPLRIRGLIPDYLVYRNGENEPFAVIDAKYRFLNRRALDDVVSQMALYLHRYDEAKVAALIFPKKTRETGDHACLGLNSDIKEAWHGKFEQRKTPLFLYLLDLDELQKQGDSSTQNPKGVEHQVEDILKELCSRAGR